jgi:hypothetical protein
LPGAEIISAAIQDVRYNYELPKLGPENETSRMLRGKLFHLIHQLSNKRLLTFYELLDELNACFAGLGATVGQTIGTALAQIQVIAKKHAWPPGTHLIARHRVFCPGTPPIFGVRPFGCSLRLAALLRNS